MLFKRKIFRLKTMQTFRSDRPVAGQTKSDLKNTEHFLLATLKMSTPNFNKNIGALLLGAAIAFLLLSAVLQATWNYAVPRLVKSVQKRFRQKDFRPISFTTAMVTMIFISLVMSCQTCSTVFITKRK